MLLYSIGKARVVFSCFTAFERLACMEAIIDLFLQKNNKCITSVIVIDKDLQEQEAIEVIFVTFFRILVIKDI